MSKNRTAEATDFEYLLYKTLSTRHLLVKSYLYDTLGEMRRQRLPDKSSSMIFMN